MTLYRQRILQFEVVFWYRSKSPQVIKVTSDDGKLKQNLPKVAKTRKLIINLADIKTFAKLGV